MDALVQSETRSHPRPCVACRTQIDPEATLCPTCRSYQANWKNWLPYIGSTVGLVAILVSASTFIAANAHDWYKAATWKDDVKVAVLEYPGQAGFMNSGDGTVVISSISVELDPKKVLNIPINLQIDSGKFGSVALTTLYRSAENVDGAPWAKSPDGAFNEKLEDTATNYGNLKRCAEFHIYNADHPGLKMIDTMEPDHKLISGPVKAQLNVVSLHTGEQFPVKLPNIRIAFLFIPRETCKQQDFGVDLG